MREEEIVEVGPHRTLITAANPYASMYKAYDANVLANTGLR